MQSECFEICRDFIFAIYNPQLAGEILNEPRGNIKTTDEDFPQDSPLLPLSRYPSSLAAFLYSC